MPKMKTNPMANFQAKDNSFQCMSGWNCSIPNLESRCGRIALESNPVFADTNRPKLGLNWP